MAFASKGRAGTGRRLLTAIADRLRPGSPSRPRQRPLRRQLAPSATAPAAAARHTVYIRARRPFRSFGHQFRSVGRRGRDQSRQQFPGAARTTRRAYGFGSALRTNPGGGGASEATDAPRFRTWGEAYGISATNGASGDFVGDQRQTWGGVAGVGATVAPGVNLGVSVDQSRTAIDVPLALQSATLDLTQFGFNASVDKGPWTWAIALVHGFGKINSSRDTGFGIASAGYNARIDGALTELSYYWSMDQSRIVPKGRVRICARRDRIVPGDRRSRSGDGDRQRPWSVRAILIGAEIGHYWIFDRKIFDLSAYGKFVDNLVQNFSSITVSLGAESITVQGIGESRYGADAGASASLSLTNTVRLYVNYDGKFRAATAVASGHAGRRVEVVARRIARRRIRQHGPPP